MTSSTLLVDPPSNETIDVFYIQKNEWDLCRAWGEMTMNTKLCGETLKGGDHVEQPAEMERYLE